MLSIIADNYGEQIWEQLRPPKLLNLWSNRETMVVAAYNNVLLNLLGLHMNNKLTYIIKHYQKDSEWLNCVKMKT